MYPLSAPKARLLHGNTGRSVDELANIEAKPDQRMAVTFRVAPFALEIHPTWQDAVLFL